MAELPVQNARCSRATTSRDIFLVWWVAGGAVITLLRSSRALVTKSARVRRPWTSRQFLVGLCGGPLRCALKLALNRGPTHLPPLLPPVASWTPAALHAYLV